jgi:hypothetical protein
MAHDHHGAATKGTNARDERPIITEVPVAMQLNKIGDQLVDVVQGMGPGSVPSK